MGLPILIYFIGITSIHCFIIGGTNQNTGPTVSECQDNQDNCFTFDDEKCVGTYATWAKLHCAYRCGYCPDKHPPCEDEISYCKELDASACTTEFYQGFIREKCRKTCNKCTVPALTYKETTDSVGNGNIVPTESSEIGQPTVQNKGCKDKLANCFRYPDSKCVGIYEPWARDNCALRCGYCPDKPPCVDLNQHCGEYGGDICTTSIYAGFARTNCRKYCNMCGVPALSFTVTTHSTTGNGNSVSTTPTVTGHSTTTVENKGCKDMLDNCFRYPDSKCVGIYEPWARDNCAFRCGYCPDKPPCVDLNKHCGEYGSDICTSSYYAGFARTNCRKFCDMCGVCNRNFSESVPACCGVCSCPGEEVFGRVINQHGEPVVNAQVSFSECDCVRYFTDTSGNFVVHDICVRGHEIVYSAGGYQPSKVVPVPTIAGGKFWKADIMLLPKM